MIIRAHSGWRLASVVLVVAGTDASVTAREPVRARNGMVASSSPIASEIGIEILKKGGNAVDAAVATAFALAVVLPQAGNLGGGGFAVVRDGASGQVLALDFREKAPERAHPFIFVDEGGEVIPEKSTVGIFSAGVPGSVAGLEALHLRLGRLPWPALLQPAIRLARHGFTMNWEVAHDLIEEADRLARFPESAAIFLPGGMPLIEGELLVQDDLACTLQIIADRRAAGFYGGEVARRIHDASRQYGGLLSLQDLERYRPVWRDVLTSRWRDLTIHSMPPPSSGGVTLIEILNILEPHDLAALGVGGSLFTSTVAEACRRAFADRAEHLGDPDYVAVPVSRLVSKDYARLLRLGIVPGRPTPLDALKREMREAVETTHLSVADRDGNLVALTTTLNESFGSGLVVAGTGFLLNDEMDDFVSRPGSPNVYGLLGGRKNSVEPGKRMLSSMAPTIVMREGAPYLVLGARGGPRIITAVLQVILNVRVFGMNVQDAVDQRRFHFQGSPDEILHDPGAFSPDTAEALCLMGYRLRQRDDLSDVQSVAIEADGFAGASDPRRAGEPRGY